MVRKISKKYQVCPCPKCGFPAPFFSFSQGTGKRTGIRGANAFAWVTFREYKCPKCGVFRTSYRW